MRIDKTGTVHGLEEDIQELWKSHGWAVHSETVPRSHGKKFTTWIIKAKIIDAKPEEKP